MTIRVDTGSFRDPSGGVIHLDGEIYRYFNGPGASDFSQLSATDFFTDLVASGQLIESCPVSRKEAAEIYAQMKDAELVIRHPRIPFISYPYEWSFEMLKVAAECHLDIARRAFEAGYLIKDATPFNIQFVGHRPVFIDVASIEPYQDGAHWTAYAQFCQMFLNPLRLQELTGVAFQPWLRGSLEGIDVDQLRRLLPLRSKFRKDVFLDVVLQHWFNRAFAANEQAVRSLAQRPVPSSSVAKLLKRMANQTKVLKRPKSRSMWSDYEANRSHYSARGQQFKEDFVRSTLQTQRAKTVWDLGCNRGQFSLIAAEAADYVIAMDADEASVAALYERIRGKVDNLLPLVIDLLNPSPALGWAGEERQSLAARGRPDSFLCLALIHHLSITGNVPLGMVARWLSSIAGAGIVEFVPKDDPMVQRLLITRRDVYHSYSQGDFEANIERHFQINQRAPIPDSGRTLYVLGPR